MGNSKKRRKKSSSSLQSLSSSTSSNPALSDAQKLDLKREIEKFNKMIKSISMMDRHDQSDAKKDWLIMAMKINDKYQDVSCLNLCVRDRDPYIRGYAYYALADFYKKQDNLKYYKFNLIEAERTHHLIASAEAADNFAQGNFSFEKSEAKASEILKKFDFRMINKQLSKELSIPNNPNILIIKSLSLLVALGLKLGIITENDIDLLKSNSGKSSDSSDKFSDSDSNSSSNYSSETITNRQRNQKEINAKFDDEKNNG